MIFPNGINGFVFKPLNKIISLAQFRTRIRLTFLLHFYQYFFFLKLKVSIRSKHKLDFISSGVSIRPRVGDTPRIPSGQKPITRTQTFHSSSVLCNNPRYTLFTDRLISR